mgnify:CR=1 FL=1|tara:strand:+ start:680 stop:928 length:249 start_codon:yes stop_codon:yes gene_type:complete
MFENFGTAIVQAVGFFGVFGFFVYRLLSEKVSSNTLEDKTKNKSPKLVKTVSSEKKGLFGRKKNVEKIIEVKKEKKRGWFNR